MLNELSTVPQRIHELTKSAAHAGTRMVLARVKAFFLDVDHTEMVGGFPQYNIDGTEFSSEDFARCVKETRVAATEMVEELNLTNYQPTYGEDNKCISPPEFTPLALTPPRRKPTFAPDIDSSTLITEDAIFQKLSTIQWKPRNF